MQICYIWYNHVIVYHLYFLFLIGNKKGTTHFFYYVIGINVPPIKIISLLATVT